jgi:hypothetical protein
MAYPDSMQPTNTDDAYEQAQMEGKQPSPGELAKHWERELRASVKWLEKFCNNARKIERVFVDKREVGREGENHYNVFWANVQVILAAVYGRLPKAEVDRSFNDFDDDVARVAANMMQRILNNDIGREYDDTQAVLRDALQDRFVAGLGTCWVRYEAKTQQVELAPGVPTEMVVSEEAYLDYVRWEDLLYSPVRRWRDARWVARRCYMTRPMLIKRFGETIGKAVPLRARTADKGGSDSDPFKASPQKQAEVWEIWCNETRSVYWHCKGYDVILDYKPDFLKLEGFYPCPEPVTATTGTDAFIPTADYILASDQYEELNEVCGRISLLVRAIRVAGVYDKNNDGVQRILNEGADNRLIPIDNWALFAERGGLKGSVDWFPVDMVTDALMKLKDRKRELMDEIYELLGISDIMRGVSSASETATAQSLKVQYGGARVANLQASIARFVAQCLRLRAEIIAGHFQAQTIMERSQIERTPDAYLAQEALALLKDEGMAAMRLQVNADSMSAPDWQAEKEQRTEYVAAVGNFIERVWPLIQAEPGATPFLVKILQWAAAGFRAGKQIESVLDQALNALTQSQTQPQPPKEPSPNEQKALASADKYSAEAENKRAETTMTTGVPSQAFAKQKPQPQAPPGGMPMNPVRLPTNPMQRPHPMPPSSFRG